jgi:hypothetical protein
MSDAIRSPVYGPFEVIGELSADGREILSLPFSDVVGCNILVSLADNYSIIPFQVVPNHLYPNVELSVWGAIQGYQACLRRIQLHMFTGPARMLFESSEGWTNLSFRAQNMCGGSTVNGAGIPPQPTQANKFSLKVSIYVMPRSGFAIPGSSGFSGINCGAP